MKRSAKRTQFLNNLLVDALEGDMTEQWASYLAIDRDGDLNILKAVLSDEIEPINAKPQVWTATIETMAKGLGVWRRAKESGEPAFYPSTPTGLTEADESNGEDGDYDAMDADAILQLGLFGKVIYG